MKIILILAIGLILAFAWGCKAKKKNMETLESVVIENSEIVKDAVVPDEEVKVLSVAAKSCRGRCAVYNLEVSGYGDATYVGTKNVDNIGSYSARWNMNNVVTLFEESGFSNLDDTYLSGAKDIQKFEIVYNAKKVVFHKVKAPTNLKELYTSLETMIGSQEWKKVEN